MSQRIQIILLITALVVGLRVAYVFYERHEDNVRQANKPQAPPLNPDDYVTPTKIYAYDLKSAQQQLREQPEWVKVGYSIAYYSYGTEGRHVDFSHESGLLLPLERVLIKDVVAETAPKAPGQRQLMAVFAKDGKTYAFSIGAVQGSDYHFYANDMLFIQDPHELYKHWPADIWDAIDKHEVKPGMSELQTDFSIGLGMLEGGGDENLKTLDYPNGGKPLDVTYQNGRATEIKPGSPG